MYFIPNRLYIKEKSVFISLPAENLNLEVELESETYVRICQIYMMEFSAKIVVISLGFEAMYFCFTDPYICRDIKGIVNPPTTTS